MRSNAPLLVTLGIDLASFDRLDGLRRRHFPPERSFIPAHISLFHHLPPDEPSVIHDALAAVATSTARISLRFADLFRLGGGFAVRVESERLSSIHEVLAGRFAPWLTPQDRQPFRPHVTLMNKASRDEAEMAYDEARATWSPWDAAGESLLLWRYLGGPWEAVARYPFEIR